MISVLIFLITIKKSMVGMIKMITIMIMITWMFIVFLFQWVGPIADMSAEFEKVDRWIHIIIIIIFGL